MEEICEGCKGSCGISSSMKFHDDGTLSICPCVSCLIKVVCTQGCDEFSDYVDKEDEYYDR